MNYYKVPHNLGSFSLACGASFLLNFKACISQNVSKGFPAENLSAEVVRFPPTHTFPTPLRETLHIVYTFLLLPLILTEIMQKAHHLSNQLCKASLKSACGHRAAGWAGRQK